MCDVYDVCVRVWRKQHTGTTIEKTKAKGKIAKQIKRKEKKKQNKTTNNGIGASVEADGMIKF